MPSEKLSKIGIIAGGGALPRTLQVHCDSHGIETFTVGFDGQTDAETLQGRDHVLTRIGAAGQIVALLHTRGCRDLVIIGSVKRPKLSQMRPDMRTISFFAKLGLRAIGDDGLLKALRAALEEEGFVIHGIQEIVDGLLMPSGLIGSVQPNAAQLKDIEIGLAASRKIGRRIGQSVVVCNGMVVDTEDDAGTNALIRRAAKPGAILVKSSKPQQDRKLDMPTLGSATVQLCADLGYAGIAAEAGGVLLADRVAMIAMADARGLFMVGV